MVLISVDIDHEACEELMRSCGFSTQADAINYALRSQVKQRRALEGARARAETRMTPEEIESHRGIGWEGDLEEMRGGHRSL